MRLIGVYFAISILFFSCKQQSQVKFLQQNSIKLAQPRVITNNTFIDSFTTLQAQLKLEEVKIKYTSNGDTPSLDSEEYNKPIKVYKAGVYKFKAFHKYWQPSEVTEIALYKKGMSANSITCETEPSKKYQGQGDYTLINQKKASLNFTDKQWVGFDTVAISTVKFDKKTAIKKLTISYLNDVSSWIFPPERITVLINEDLKIEKYIEPLKHLIKRKNETITIPIDAKVETLKIQIYNRQSIPEWHEGKGAKAWLFIDEFIFN